jgi:ketosteroid isomerase-like protein
VAAACGESDQEQAREVVQDYVDARNDGDFEQVCADLSESFKQELGSADCPAFLAEQTSGADGAEELELVDVRVSDERATADIDVVRESQGPSRIVVVLEREDGEWRITALQ